MPSIYEYAQPGLEPFNVLNQQDAEAEGRFAMSASEQLTCCDPGPKTTPQGIIVMTALIDSTPPEPTFENQQPDGKCWAPYSANPMDHNMKRGDIAMSIVGGPAYTTKVAGMPDGVAVFCSMNGREMNTPMRFVGVADWAQDGLNLNQDQAGTIRIFGPVTIVNRSFRAISPGQLVFASPSPAVCIVNGKKVPGLLTTGMPETKFLPATITMSIRDIESLHEELCENIEEHFETFDPSQVKDFLNGITLFLRNNLIHEWSPLDAYGHVYAHFLAYKECPDEPLAYKALIEQMAIIYEKEQLEADRYTESIDSPPFEQAPFEHPFDQDLPVEKDPDILECQSAKGTIHPALLKKRNKLERMLFVLLGRLKSNYGIFMAKYRMGRATNFALPGAPLDLIIGL